MSTQTETKPFTLNYLKTIGIVNNGDNGRGFANPYDVTISRDGRIFILNRCDPVRESAMRIGICSLDEEYLGEFGNGFGSGDGQFVWPVAMAFDKNERLYITDEYNHRVAVYDSSGKYLSQWGAFGDGDAQLNGPAGIAIDAGDNVFVVDQKNNRVQTFTLDGDYVGQWGKEGSGEGQLNLPWGVAVDSDGAVYVADWGNDRIQKFSPEGGFLASYGAPGQGDGEFHRPSSVAVDPEGYIYVADWGNERVQVLGPDGGFKLNERGQATLSKWAEEYLAVNPEEKVVRDRSNLIPDLPPHLDTPHLISSQTEPYFWGPVSVKLDAEGRLYVSETNRHRIQIFQTR